LGAIIMAQTPIELTEAEWQVIKAVWEKEPCTAPEVQERLQTATSWTYSTVRTFMDRMAAKGVLDAVKEGKLTWFRSRVSREQAQRGELLYTLKHAFDGAMTPLVQCLLETRGLTEKDLDDLDALIRERRKRSKK
jgi:BlaI family penicillinase repressor